jgi:hypothetical protein
VTEIAPRRVVLFGGAQDGLEMDAPIDATHVYVPEWDLKYAARMLAHPALPAMGAYATIAALHYRDSGRVSGRGLAIFELVA